MKRRLLVLRPQPGADATVRAAQALGFDALAAPLFAISPVAWSLPDPLPDAVLMTSASATRHGGAKLEFLRSRPLYAVGEATANAAHQAGFTTIVVGDDGVDAILALAHADGIESLLHLAGREHHTPINPPIWIERRIVYAADAIDRLPDDAGATLPEAVALLHSARAAGTFATLLAEAGLSRSQLRIAAISEAACVAAGPGWAASAVAAAPTDAALLAVAAELCDQ